MAECVEAVRFSDSTNTDTFKAEIWEGYDGYPRGFLGICIKNRYGESEGFAEFTLTHAEARALRDLLTKFVDRGEP